MASLLVDVGRASECVPRYELRSGKGESAKKLRPKVIRVSTRRGFGLSLYLFCLEFIVRN